MLQKCDGRTDGRTNGRPAFLCPRSALRRGTKTMSADGGHLEYPIGKKNITFVEVHSRTIHAMFALNWFTGFRGENF